MVSEAGLYYASAEEAAEHNWIYAPERLVPLKGVHAEAVVVETTAEVKITQKYVNYYAFPIEAIYVFPLDEHAAVCEFEAEIQGKKIIGIVKEKEQAKVEYNRAIKRGDGAYLLEQAKADIFRAKVGNIPPGEEVTISIKYVSEMKCEMEKVRFLLPTYVAPRYTPAGSTPEEIAVSGAEPSRAYLLSLKVTALSVAGFTSIESPSHAISTTMSGNMATIELDHGVTELNKDFLVLLTYNSPHEPKVVLEEDGKGSYAAMITLFPHLEFLDVKSELIFVVDRSGSMQPKVQDLRDALQLFMRSLPEDSHFNIVGFGDSFTKLFPTSKPYNDDTLQVALNHISTLHADLGGTELLEPLEDVFRSSVVPGCARQVFVLTDGQISNTDRVLALVQKNNKQTRVFSLGIGSSVSHHLVEGLARAGKGTAHFVMENERMERKVMKQLKDATQPALNEVQVDWGVGLGSHKKTGSIGAAIGAKVLALFSHGATAPPPAAELQQAPSSVPPIFSDDHFRIYAIFSTSKLPEKVTVNAKSPDGTLHVELPVDREKMIKGSLLHTLAARSLIRDLEEGTSRSHTSSSQAPMAVKAEIVRLGIKYSLASKHTSFLAIEEREKSSAPGSDCFESPEPPKPEDDMPSYSFAAAGFGGGMAKSANKKKSKPAKSYSMAPSFGGAPPPPAPMAQRSLAPTGMAAPKGGMLRRSSTASESDGDDDDDDDGEMFGDMDEEMEEAGEDEGGAVVMEIAQEEKKVMRKEKEKKVMKKEEKKETRSHAKDKKMSTPASAAPASAAPAPISPRAQMSALLALQTTKGDYGYSEKLAAAIGVPFATLAGFLASVPQLAEIQDANVRERVWATVLALTFLKKKLAGLADEWELVDKKGRKWLAAQGVSQLDPIFSEAAGLIV